MRQLTLVSAVAAGTLAAGASAAVLPGVRSPSGNIRCVYASSADSRNRGQLFCTIGSSSYGLRLQNTCRSQSNVDWHGFLLPRAGRGQVVCSGGALWFGSPRYATVAYGSSRHVGPYRCRSAAMGLTCTNGHGHGLFLSRASWRAW